MFHHHIKELPPLDHYRFFTAHAMVQRWYQYETFKGFGVNCHVVARVMARLLRARVASGYLLVVNNSGERLEVVNHEHSWVCLQGYWILDVKPIGMMSLGPVLVDTTPGASAIGPMYRQYRCQEFPPCRRQAVRRDVSELCRRTAKILETDPITSEEIIAYYGGGR